MGEAVDIGAHGSEQTMHVTPSGPHSAGQCPMQAGHSFLTPGVHPLPFPNQAWGSPWGIISHLAPQPHLGGEANLGLPTLGKP